MALILLFLITHAFLVSAAHSHRSLLEQTSSDASRSAHATRDAPTENGWEANSHAQCLLCRLQRNFIAEMGGQSAQPAAPEDSFQSSLDPLNSPPSNGVLLAPAGRAPPRA